MFQPKKKAYEIYLQAIAAITTIAAPLLTTAYEEWMIRPLLPFLIIGMQARTYTMDDEGILNSIFIARALCAQAGLYFSER